MPPGIQRQAEQYGLDVPPPTHAVPEHLVAELLRSGNRIHANTLNHRQAGEHSLPGDDPEHSRWSEPHPGYSGEEVGQDWGDRYHQREEEAGGEWPGVHRPAEDPAEHINILPTPQSDEEWENLLGEPNRMKGVEPLSDEEFQDWARSKHAGAHDSPGLHSDEDLMLDWMAHQGREPDLESAHDYHHHPHRHEMGLGRHEEV